MRVIQERNSGNTPTVAYTRGSDLSASLEGAGGIGGLLARSVYSGGAWGSHNSYHADGNGNVTALVDSSQAVSAGYRYNPYGQVIGLSGGSMTNQNVYRFSSKDQMPNSGLYYYGYRFYDPNLQRWLNRDPLGKDGGVNLFSFVGNDSANNIDRLGLFGSDVHDRYWELDSGWTDSYWPWSCHLHFPRDLGKIEDKLRKDIANCNRKKFLSHMHSGQDWFGHPHGRFWPIGHAPETLCGKCPDKYPDAGALVDMDEWKQHWEAQWMENCGELPQPRHPRPE
jgi:RHS repeat-associated protein